MNTKQYIDILISTFTKYNKINKNKINKNNIFTNLLININYPYINELIDNFNNVMYNQEYNDIHKILEGLDDEQKTKLIKFNLDFIEIQLLLLINKINYYLFINNNK